MCVFWRISKFRFAIHGDLSLMFFLFFLGVCVCLHVCKCCAGHMNVRYCKHHWLCSTAFERTKKICIWYFFIIYFFFEARHDGQRKTTSIIKSSFKRNWDKTFTFRWVLRQSQETRKESIIFLYYIDFKTSSNTMQTNWIACAHTSFTAHEFFLFLSSACFLFR